MNTKVKLKRLLLSLAAVAVAVCMAALPIAASGVPEVTLGGDAYTGSVKLIDGTTYVRLREFSELHGANVTWDSREALAGAFTRQMSLLAETDSKYITANGRYLWCSAGAFIEDGRMYVPLRAIGSAFGYDTAWDRDTFSASLTRSREAIESADSYYVSEDLYWLSRIISAEAQGEPLLGKLAVGAVVLNRVERDDFPSTVRGVIFDRKNGVQFTPVSNGTIYNTPDRESLIAAKLCLEGLRTSEDILFFINTRIAESFWITENRQYVMSVGNHDFYA